MSLINYIKHVQVKASCLRRTQFLFSSVHSLDWEVCLSMTYVYYAF